MNKMNEGRRVRHHKSANFTSSSVEKSNGHRMNSNERVGKREEEQEGARDIRMEKKRK